MADVNNVHDEVIGGLDSGLDYWTSQAQKSQFSTQMIFDAMNKLSSNKSPSLFSTVSPFIPNTSTITQKDLEGMAQQFKTSLSAVKIARYKKAVEAAKQLLEEL